MLPSLNGDGTVIAVAPYAVGTNGEVRVYKRDSSNTWTQQGQTVQGSAGDHAGYEIKIARDGLSFVFSAPWAKDPSTGTTRGYIKAYTWDASTNSWKQSGNTVYGWQDDKRFGQDLAASADCKMFVTGTMWYNHPTTGAAYAGMVAVYELKNDQWVQVGDRFYDDPPHTDFGFGEGIAMTGDGSAIAFHDPAVTKNQGSVSVYQRTSSGWEKVGKTLEGESGENEFGRGRLALSDNGRLAVGARYWPSRREDTGKVYVYATSA